MANQVPTSTITLAGCFRRQLISFVAGALLLATTSIIVADLAYERPVTAVMRCTLYDGPAEAIPGAYSAIYAVCKTGGAL